MITLALLASASAADVSVGVLAGSASAALSAGAEVETASDPDQSLQVRTELGLYARTLGASFPLAATPSAEVAWTFPVGRARLGPAVVADVLITGPSEQSCSMGYGCRYWTSWDQGVLVVPGVGGGLRWSRQGQRVGVDLGFAIQPIWHYDIGVPIPRTDLDIHLPSGLILGADVSRFEGSVSVGKML